MADDVNYLNRNNTSPMFNKLRRVIDESKQGRASPAQWASIIKALTTKGVKSLEIDESKIIGWLETADPAKPVTREELSKRLDSLSFTIKEVRLERPRYSSHRQGGGEYHEYLYIANSERDNVADELEQVEYEMNELVYSPEVFSDDPELPIRLERRRSELIELKNTAIDFSQHHFTEQAGRHGKNLLAHCRVTRRPDENLYFIEEVQSDWAQRGRRDNWKSIPVGPLVTSTEAWAGMVLRRHFQLAAANPQVNTIGWITETMRNGGRQNLAYEAQKVEKKKVFDQALKEGIDQGLTLMHADQLPPDGLVEAKRVLRKSVERDLSLRGIAEPGDMLNDFYLKVIPKMVDKILAGTGEKVVLRETTVGGNQVTIPTIAITDAVRARLIDKQPVYSRANLVRGEVPLDDNKLLAVVKSAAKYLGSAKHLHLVNHLYDVSTGQKVAGLYTNRLAMVSLHAKDIEEVADHECFHFAQEQLLTTAEMNVLRKEFATDSPLNMKVREILTRRGDFILAKDCLHPDECAAQGFALWAKQELDVTPPVQTMFGELLDCVKDVVRWVRSEVLLQKNQTVEEIFSEFWVGNIAKRHQEQSQSTTEHHYQTNQTNERPRPAAREMA